MRPNRRSSVGAGAALLLIGSIAQARQTDPPYADADVTGQGGSYGAQYSTPGYASPPPPPEERSRGFEMPPLSIRVDPLNWLLEGRLGFELEAAVWEFVTVELVPVFVVDREPPMLNLRSREHRLEQGSNGLGPLSGASLGAGFWLGGKPLQGYVLRAIFTNYAYTYETSDSIGRVDQVSHTERRFIGMLGSQSRFGAFTIGWGFGLGVELNRKERCYPTGSLTLGDVVEGDADQCRGTQEIAIDRNVTTVADLNGWAHPVYLMGRFSLGVTFD